MKKYDGGLTFARNRQRALGNVSYMAPLVQIRKLVDSNLVEPITEGKRAYRLVMAPDPLTSFIMRRMDELGLLLSILAEDFD